MKSHKEIFVALLSGKTIIHKHGISLKLSKEGQLVNPKTGTHLGSSFHNPKEWSILTPPREFVVKINPIEIAARGKVHRQHNKDAALVSQRVYYYRNRATILAKKASYHKKNRATILAKQAIYRIKTRMEKGNKI